MKLIGRKIMVALKESGNRKLEEIWVVQKKKQMAEQDLWEARNRAIAAGK